MRILVEPISALKRAAELVERVRTQRRPLIITQNGRAAVVMQDVESYEEREEALALLKLCLDAERGIAEGQAKPLAAVRTRAEARLESMLRQHGDE